MTNRQIKRKAKTFSLTNEEMQGVLDRAKHHGFKDRNEYVLALLEADNALRLEVELDAAKQKVLRPKRVSGEDPAAYLTRRFQEEDKRSSAQEAEAAEKKRRAKPQQHR